MEIPTARRQNSSLRTFIYTSTEKPLTDLLNLSRPVCLDLFVHVLKPIVLSLKGFSRSPDCLPVFIRI